MQDRDAGRNYPTSSKAAGRVRRRSLGGYFVCTVSPVLYLPTTKSSTAELALAINFPPQASSPMSA
jgi:hypothetical protein